MDGDTLEVRSEFAWVRVTLDHAANGPRLRVEDRKNGCQVWLDPLELATLAALRHEEIAALADPSLHSPRHRAQRALLQAGGIVEA